MATKNKRTTVSLTGNPLNIAEKALEEHTTSLVKPSLSEIVGGIVEEWSQLKRESEAPKRGKKP